jgi:hypothetical protein
MSDTPLTPAQANLYTIVFLRRLSNFTKDLSDKLAAHGAGVVTEAERVFLERLTEDDGLMRLMVEKDL